MELEPGQTLQLQEGQLSAVEYARLVAQGRQRARAHGPWLGVQLRSPLWAGASICQGLRAGYTLELPRLSLGAAEQRRTSSSDERRALRFTLGGGKQF